MIFRSFVFDADKSEDENDHECVLVKFDSHFVPKLNVIYERAEVHRRTQKTGEHYQPTFVPSMTLPRLVSSIIKRRGSAINW